MAVAVTKREDATPTPSSYRAAWHGKGMADWPLTGLQFKLLEIGTRVVRHARAIIFRLAEIAVTGLIVQLFVAAIQRLRWPPSPVRC